MALVMLVSTSAAEAPKKLEPDHASRMARGTSLFKESVRTILVEQCLECHGGKSVKADFDLSTRKALLESGMIDKTAEDSYLMSLLTHAEEPFMPFKAPKLAKSDIGAIARWIDLGTPYDKPLVEGVVNRSGELEVTDSDRQFWSFQPLTAVDPPVESDDRWGRTPIDRFIMAKLSEKELHPNPSADRRTLIRRATFDLLGLPPTPEEVEEFVNDPDPLAYEKLIDRLLASAQFGERWARHWMDVARFAESHGYEQDYDRPHAYHYRDFLIKAINDDMPYDQFVRWQLAGDEVAPEDPLAMTATGFLGAGAFPTQLTEAEFESARYDELDDMTATTGVAFLGLSVGCARCHDHKYDPIPTRDYYRLAATFTTTIRSEVDLQLKPDAEPVKVQVNSEGLPHMKHHADGRGYPHFYPKTYFLERGDVHQKKEEVTSGFLQVLTDPSSDESRWRHQPSTAARTSLRRQGLAEWIVDTERGAGHLAARVVVNRLWAHHFGQGIVATPNDFGFQGERPTHPELLDWLAAELVRNGWRLKPLHKLMMTSSVYRQDGAFDEDRASIDRENRFLWRRAPRRLEGEAIRDAALSVSGMLDPSMYGPGTLDQAMRRRSVYFFVKRSKLIPMMMLFDWPEHLVSIARRATTTTAPQALFFMNNPQGRLLAKGLAERAEKEAPGEAIGRAFVIALGRKATEREIGSAKSFLVRQASEYRESGKPNPKRLAMIDLCQSILSMNEFVYVD
ncbi:DUF1549 domain-containing protein [Planctomycetes bacterium Pan216]